jgi:hypothetical protein
MTAHAILALGFVICIITVIAAIGRRDAPTAAAGTLGAVALGILALLSHERDRYDGWRYSHPARACLSGGLGAIRGLSLRRP